MGQRTISRPPTPALVYRLPLPPAQLQLHASQPASTSPVTRLPCSSSARGGCTAVMPLRAGEVERGGPGRGCLPSGVCGLFAELEESGLGVPRPVHSRRRWWRGKGSAGARVEWCGGRAAVLVLLCAALRLVAVAGERLHSRVPV